MVKKTTPTGCTFGWIYIYYIIISRISIDYIYKCVGTQVWFMRNDVRARKECFTKLNVSSVSSVSVYHAGRKDKVSIVCREKDFLCSRMIWVLPPPFPCGMAPPFYSQYVKLCYTRLRE